MARELGDDAARKEVLVALGDTELTLGRYGEAREHFEEARDLAGDTAERQRLYERRAETFTHQGEYEAAVEAARASLALAVDDTGDDGPTVEEGSASGDGSASTRDGGSALGGGSRSVGEHADDALGWTRDPAGEGPAATAEVSGLLCAIANALEQTGDLSAAGEVAARACECASAADARDQEARALFRRGNAAYRRGDFAAAVEQFEESLAVHREMGHRREQARALNNLGAVASSPGRPPIYPDPSTVTVTVPFVPLAVALPRNGSVPVSTTTVSGATRTVSNPP
ncbi:hypothetical protein BRD00_07535 [Halobacteriales archaeon QS_8_69_26]|nr:MAG: hypothetical protein BRD00_07535 [Halobacteriales archaeon QS_8_69_26]